MRPIRAKTRNAAALPPPHPLDASFEERRNPGGNGGGGTEDPPEAPGFVIKVEPSRSSVSLVVPSVELKIQYARPEVKWVALAYPLPVQRTMAVPMTELASATVLPLALTVRSARL